MAINESLCNPGWIPLYNNYFFHYLKSEQFSKQNIHHILFPDEFAVNSQATLCSVKCGKGKRIYATVNCNNQNGNNEAKCDQSLVSTEEECELEACPPNDYGQWSSWTPCSITCKSNVNERSVSIVSSPHIQYLKSLDYDDSSCTIKLGDNEKSGNSEPLSNDQFHKSVVRYSEQHRMQFITNFLRATAKMAIANNFVLTKKFTITKFDCTSWKCLILYIEYNSYHKTLLAGTIPSRIPQPLHF